MWIEYGKGSMNIQIAHDFEQIAWIQLCQFNPKHLKEANKSITLFEEISYTNKLWQNYLTQTQIRGNFINLILQCRTCSIIEEWIQREAQRAIGSEQTKSNTNNNTFLASQNHKHNSPTCNAVTVYYTEGEDEISEPSDSLID